MEKFLITLGLITDVCVHAGVGSMGTVVRVTTYEGCEVILTKGDIITSKKGMLFKINLIGTEEFYYVFKAKYLGDGHWEAMRKEPAEATKIVSVG